LTAQQIAPLRRGSRVAVVSPASAARHERIDRGCERLRAFGYEPMLMPHAKSSGPLYYAGTAEERAGDLQAAFADPSVDGIVCTRGGWGSAELLPLLDANLIRSNPKIFVAYSDQTSLQTWMWNECRLPSVYGPMAAADWWKDEGVHQLSWRAAVEGGGEHTYTPIDGLRALTEGRAEGRLLGGCLALLEAALGTPYALRIDEPCILFLEDIGVKPYQWDRMLQHLRFAGMMHNVNGVVLGDMSANVEPEEMPMLEQACLHALRGFTGPIAIGLRCGHVSSGNRSLRLGSLAELRCEQAAELVVK
jgi:muramoyltetrapeptide carboxypeptidase